MNCGRQLFQGPLGPGQYYGLIGLEQTTGFARGYDYSQGRIDRDGNQPSQTLSEVMSFRVAAPHMVIVLLSSETILSI